MKQKKIWFNKKLLLSIFIVLISFSLLACSPIKLTTTQHSSGQVTMTLEVDVSSLNVLDRSRRKAYDIASHYFTQLNNAYISNLIEIFSNMYDFNELNIQTEEGKYAYIIQNHSQFLAGTEITPSAESFTQDFTTIKIDFSFMSIYAYLMYFYPNAFVYNESTNSIAINSEEYASLIDIPVASLSVEEVEHLFTIDNIQKCSPFSYNGKEPCLLESVVIDGTRYDAGTSIVQVICQELNLNREEAEYLYTFITPYSRVHSDGTITNNNEGKVHTWNLGNNINGVITLWRTTANYVAYYILGAIVGIAVLGIGSFVIFLIQKKKKKDDMNLLKKVDELMNSGR